MFKKIRRKLTLLYAALFFGLLLAFTTITVSGATWAVLYELKQEVRLLSHEEAEEQAAVYKVKGVFADSDDEDDTPEGLFYYILNADGTIVANATPTKLQPAVLAQVRNWQEASETTILKKITTTTDREPLVFLLTAEPIMNDTMHIGTVFFGRDITVYYHLFRWILAALLLLLLLFLLLAVWAGYLLAGRAMVPIAQSFARQREFTADASHELRTPLSILMASTDAIQTDKENTLSSFSVQVLDDMREEIRKMGKLVGNLLTLARADSGKTELQKETFDLAAAVNAAVRTLQPIAQEKGLPLTVKTPPTLIVYADKERLQQLLFILVDNAVKYTPTGEITLTLHQDATTKTISIEVSDTGIGIAPEEHAKIFDRFYRSDKIRSRELGGTGLGLAIAAWIVQAHDGSITVDSRPEAGTTFTVRLPQK